MKIQRHYIKSSVGTKSKRVMADADIGEEVTDLLFEAEDVADLVANVTGEDVAVEVSEDGETVEFNIGDETYSCTAESTDEIVESASRINRGTKKVSASTNRKPRSRMVRKISR